MGGMLGTARPTVNKWVISGPKALPDSVFARNAADAKRQVAAMLRLPRGWTFEWEKETNGSYIFVPYNSKGKEAGYNVLLRKASVDDRINRQVSKAKSPRRNPSIPKSAATTAAQKDRRTALDRAKSKHPAATNTLRGIIKQDDIRDAGLAYHVESPAQFASMIASRGDQSIVSGTLDTGATFIGYYGDDEVDAVASKLRRMRKIKFHHVIVIK